MPIHIYVMRHAEKPTDPADPHLSPAGAARARSLASYFPQHFGLPHLIYAAASSVHSQRPVETVTPLAVAAGCAVDSSHGDTDVAALAAALLAVPPGQNKTIVVCWRHGGIPGLMAALGAPSGSYPKPWDATVFNLILQLSHDGGGPPVLTAVTEPF